MSNNSIAEKLLIKSGRSLYRVNAPRGDTARLASLPDGAKRVTEPMLPVDVIQMLAAMISMDDNWSALRLKAI